MKTFFTALLIILGATRLLGQSPGNALQFDGTDDLVSANIPAVFNNIGANDFTMEAWVYPQAAVFSRIIFAQYSSSNFATLSLGGTANIYFYVVDSSITHSVATSANLPLNTWTHIAARWDASTLQPEVFFNGVLQASAGGGTSSTGTLDNLSLGSRPGGFQFFSGAMDEIRIWSEARTNCEIMTNYTREMVGNETNLVLYHNFNVGLPGGNNVGITNLPDLAGLFNGTLSNFLLTGTTSNWISSGATINAFGEAGWVTTLLNASSCSNEPYIFNGQPLSVTGVYQDTLTTALLGCDSLLVLNYTALEPTTGTISVSACDSYYWDQVAQTFTTSGSYSDTLTNMAGCDSVLTLNLEVNISTSGTDTRTECNPFIWIDGNTYTSDNNTATFNIAGGNMNGCDSVVTLNLTLTTLDLTVNDSSNTLSSNQAGANYQWVDCNNAYSILASETFQSFTPSENGSYAVIVSLGPCSDTSACTEIINFGLQEKGSSSNLWIYPNPAENFFIIESSDIMGTAVMTDVNGRVVYQHSVHAAKTIINTTGLCPGIYMIEIRDESGALLTKSRVAINR